MILRSLWRNWSRNIARTSLRRARTFARAGRALSAEVLEDRCLLSTITVTTLSDNLTSGDGQLSLREALQAANTNASVDGSVAGQSSTQDVIVFQAGLTGTIQLSAALGALQITDSVKIVGNGADETEIDALQNSRVFEVAASAGNVALDGLTLTGGRTTAIAAGGGAIEFASAGTLTITNGAVVANSTTGDFSPGGAIHTALGNVTIVNSTLSGNSTSRQGSMGGALYVDGGTVTITNSTISGNSTSGPGASGGGIFVDSGPLTLTQATIAANSVTGTAATGGGVWADNSVIKINNSIVAGNTSATTAPDMVADPTTFSHSLIGINDGTTLVAAPLGSPDVNGSFVGTIAVPIDAKLGPLTDNGGATETMALLVGSPAINTGSNLLAVDPLTLQPILTDQRGALFARRSGGIVDMGAFEALGAVTLSISPAGLIPENGGVAVVTATLAGTSTLDTIINLGFSGTATFLSDYVRSDTQIIIPAGQLSGSVTITSLDDAIDEQRETVIVDILSVVNGAENGVQQVTATIQDDDFPTSHVLPLPATTPTASFTVSWTGTAGVATYDVFVSEDGNAFTQFLDDTTLTSATFDGTVGHTYEFYSIATDVDGQVQFSQNLPQAVTFVGIAPAFPRTAGLEGFFFVGDRLARVLRNGTDLTFIDPDGNISSGFVSGTDVFATAWNLHGVFDSEGGTISFDDGTLWQNMRQIDGKYLTSSGRIAGVAQLGSELTFTGGTGETSPGFFINALQVEATGWGGITGYLSRHGTEIHWSNGSVWQLIPDLEGAASNGSGDPVQVLQSGPDLLFVNKNGGTSTGRYTAPDEVTADAWGGITGHLEGNSIHWSNGTVWTIVPFDGDFPVINGLWDVNGQDTRVLQNNDRLTFVNKNGGTSSGHFISQTEVVADDWGSIHGILTNGTICWVGNGMVWTQLPDLGGPYLNQDGQETGVNQLGRNLTLTDELGNVSHAILTSPKRFVEIDGQQRTGQIVGGDELVFDNCTVVWTQIPDLRGDWGQESTEDDSPPDDVTPSHSQNPPPVVSLLPTFIEQSGDRVLLLGPFGDEWLGTFVTPTKIIASEIFTQPSVANTVSDGTVKIKVVSNDHLSFSDGREWDRAAPTDLDGVYADVNLWPFI